MAANGKGDPKADPPASKSGSGNAIDGLTPPTMKFDGEGERTQIGPAPSSANVSKQPAQPSSKSAPSKAVGGQSISGKGGAPTIAGDMAAGTGLPTFASSVGNQDLSGERLLRDAPRVEKQGKMYPALNGIPLLAKIGQGGMGAVYYGVHPRLQSEVAVKVLPFHLAEQDPGMVKRFFREAQIAAMVRSPHLVNVMDVNEESGLFFLVMEFVPGRTAGQFLKMTIEGGQPGIPELDALDIVVAATIGLQAAHANQIVHRDLKPENIMVPYLNRNTTNQFDLKRSKLMDLGLARNEESNQSLTGVQAAMGTPGYMAPEQALDAKTADKRSDVFGMGATMYALLTGKPPFRGEAIMKVLMATMHEAHEPVIKVRPGISQAFSDIIDKCLDKKQDNRFPDATTLLKALRACRKQIAPNAEAEEDDGDEPALIGAIPGMSVARQPAAGVKTIVPGSGTGSGIEQTLLTGAAAPAKSKTGLYVALAAAGLILAGGAGYALTRGNPNAGTLASGTNTGTELAPNRKIPTKDELDVVKESYDMFIDRAKAKLLTDDVDGARAMLERAKSQYATLPTNEKSLDKFFDELKKSETDILGGISGRENKQKFKKKIKDADDTIAAKDYEKATTLVKEAKLLAGSTDEKSIADDKLRNIDDLMTKRDDRKRFDKLVDEMLGFEKKGATQDALDKANAALRIIPDDPDATQHAKKYADAIDFEKRGMEYKELMKQVNEAQQKGLPEKALTLAQEAQLKRPDLPDAKTKIDELAKISDKFKLEEEKKKSDELRQAKLAKLLTDGNNLIVNEMFEDAQAKLKECFDLNAGDDKSVQNLKKLVDDGLEKKRKFEEQKRIQKEFDDSAKTIVTALANEEVNWAPLAADIEKLKKIKDDQPRIAELSKELGKRLDYKKALDVAFAAFDKGGKDDLKIADQSVKAALALYPDGGRAKQLYGLLNKKNEEVRKEQFTGYLKDAEAAEKAGRLDDALKAAGDAHKLYPEDKVAGDREATLKTRIEGVNKVRETFNQKLQDADKAAKDNPDQALTILNDQKTALLKDKLIFGTELSALDKKAAEYTKAAEARAVQLVAGAVQQAKDKLTAKDLAGAIAALKAQPASVQNQQAVKDAMTSLSAIQAASGEITTLLGRSDTRYRQISVKLQPGKGEPEKARYDATVKNLQALSGDAVAKLAQSGLKDEGVSAGLKTNKDKLTGELNAILDKLDEISNYVVPKPKPVPTPGEEPTQDRSQRSQPAPKHGGGSVGEGNVDE